MMKLIQYLINTLQTTCKYELTVRYASQDFHFGLARDSHQGNEQIQLLYANASTRHKAVHLVQWDTANLVHRVKLTVESLHFPHILMVRNPTVFSGLQGG